MVAADRAATLAEGQHSSDDDAKGGHAVLTVITVTTVIAQAKRGISKGSPFDAQGVWGNGQSFPQMLEATLSQA